MPSLPANPFDRSWRPVAVLLGLWLLGTGCGTVQADEPVKKEAAPLLRTLIQLMLPGVDTAAAEADAATTRDAVEGRVPKDPQVESLWHATQGAIERQDWIPAVDQLQKLLDLPEDVAVEFPSGKWQSVRQLANDQLGTLPAEVRKEYERRYGGLARQLLVEQKTRPDPQKLVDLATRYFHTAAGAEAAATLARWHFDQQEFISATYWNTLLLKAGWQGIAQRPWQLQAAYAARAAGVTDLSPYLGTLLEPAQQQKLTLGNQSVTPGEWWTAALQRQDRLEVPSDWREFGGAPARTSVRSAGVPQLLHEWSQPLSQVPAIQRKLGQLLTDLADEGNPTIPAAEPLIVNGKVAFRDLRGVRVADLKTGRTLWHTDEGVSPERILSGVPADNGNEEGLWQLRVNAQQLDEEYQGGSADLHPLASWLFRDATTGFLSSDGEQLFVLEDVAVMTRNQSGFSGEGETDVPDPFGATWSSNRLSAYDLESGHLNWTVGGPVTREAVSLPLAGAFFFGVPTIDRDELYVVASTGQEIRLQALDPQNGKPRWSQLLAYSDTKIELDIARRWLSAPVAVQNGVVICPTTVGWLAAVDRTRRCLLWIHRYWPRDQEEEFDPASQFLTHRSLQEGWAPGAPLLHGSTILWAPPDTDTLQCLNALDGRLLWEQPREDGLYVTAISPGAVGRVSQTGLQVLKTATGDIRWQVSWDEGVRPSGRGCVCGSVFLQPLSSGELWVIEIDTGKIASKLSVPRQQPPLGNLVKVGAQCLSLGPEGCRLFRDEGDNRPENQQPVLTTTASPAERLRAAEFDLLQGNHAQAWQRLAEEGDDWPVDLQVRRQQVSWTALTGLIATDAANADQHLQALSDLADSPDEAFRVEMLRTEHWQQTGQWQLAFDRCRELAQSITDASLVVRTENADVTVARESWLRGQLQDLWATAPEPLRTELEPQLAAQIDEALKGTVDEQLKLAKWIDFHSQAPRLHWRLAEQWARGSMFSRAEAELLPWTEHADAGIAAESRLQLAVLWQKFGLTADAAVLVSGVLASDPQRQLSTGQSVEEFIREKTLATENPGEVLAAPATGPLESVRRPAAYLAQVQELTPPLDRPWFSRFSLQWEPQDQYLSFQDQHSGEWTWLAPLRSAHQDHNSEHAPYDFLGHRLILLQDGILQSISPVRKEIDWSIAVELESSTNVAAHRPIPRPLVDVSDLDGEQVFWSFRQTHLGQMVACTHRGIAIADRRTVKVFDPQTGRLRWMHRNLPPDATLLGNSEFLFVFDPSGESYAAYRLSDGRAATIPNLRDQLTRLVTVIGDDLVVMEHRPGFKLFNLTAGDAVLKRVHPVTGAVRWQTQFRPHTSVGLIDRQQLLVVHSESRSSKAGRAMDVLDLDTGRSRSFDRVPKSSDEDGLTPLIDQERIYLVANHSDFGSYNYGDSLPSIRMHGTLMAWDRGTGKQVWTRKIEEQNLVLDRFQESPLLVFLARNWRQVGDATYTSLHLLAIDKRTGEPLHDSKTPALFSGFHGLRITAPERQVELLSYNLRLLLAPKGSTPAAPAKP